MGSWRSLVSLVIVLGIVLAPSAWAASRTCAGADHDCGSLGMSARCSCDLHVLPTTQATAPDEAYTLAGAPVTIVITAWFAARPQAVTRRAAIEISPPSVSPPGLFLRFSDLRI